MPGMGKTYLQEREVPLAPISQRRLDIVSYRLKNPCLTLQQVGNKFSVSREYIRQILDKAGAPTVHLTPPKSMCRHCGNTVERRWTSGGHLKQFCSHKCWQNYLRVTLECSTCGRQFARQVSKLIARTNDPRYKDGRVFCNRHCLGVAQGCKYGFGGKGREKAAKARLEHIHDVQRKASWVKEWVWIEHLKTGLYPYQLSKRLDIPIRSIYKYFAEKRQK